MKKRNLIFVVFLTAVLTMAGFAQSRTDLDRNQCKNLFVDDFIGENLNLTAANAKIYDVLGYFSDRYGCEFVIDKGLEVTVLATVSIRDVPWNTALRNLLRSQDLDLLEREGTVYVASKDKILEEVEWWRNCFSNRPKDADPIYTEFVSLLHLPTCSNSVECGRRSSRISNIKNILSKRLSNRGTIEFDDKTSTIIISEVRSNLVALKELLKILDATDN